MNCIIMLDYEVRRFILGIPVFFLLLLILQNVFGYSGVVKQNYQTKTLSDMEKLNLRQYNE